MSEENEQDFQSTMTQESELDLLKQRADIMGVKYHPNIGVEKLEAKIEAKKQGIDLDAEQAATIAAAQEAGAPTAYASPTETQLKAERRKEALKLVRIRLANMNPIKNNMRGEIFSVGNSELGFVKKFVPFNAEQGWHVPNILLQEIQNKKYMAHYEVKEGNKKIMKNRLVPAYSVEILPNLTAGELQDLKQRQIIQNKG